MNDGKIIIDKIIAEAEEVAKASPCQGAEGGRCCSEGRAGKGE